MKTGKLGAVLTLGLAAAMALGQPTSYARTVNQIKAGVLLIESQQASGELFNPTPHVWHAMDQDKTVKPAGWTFTNPVGQTSLTEDMRTRWLANPTTLAPGDIPAAGYRLTKADAPYWEVPLFNTSDKALASFDILLLPVSDFLSLNPLERERLRRFVDQGGILWVDVIREGRMLVDEINGIPYPFSIAISSDTTLEQQADLQHPLLSFPNQMSLSDINLVGAYPSVVSRFTLNAQSSGFRAVFATVYPDSTKLDFVAGYNDGRTLAAARMGDGYMVVSSTGVAATLSRGSSGIPGSFNWLPNRSFRAAAPLNDAAQQAAAKLVINMASLGSPFLSPGSGSRRSGSTSVDVTAPLLRRLTANGSFNRTPALYKGITVLVGGSNISALDSVPGRDLDGDGNPHDGGNSPLDGYDVLWTRNLPDTASAPTVVSVANTTLTRADGSAAVDQIWLSLANGSVTVLDLQTGQVLATTTPPSPVAPDPLGPYAPTVHDGFVAVADTRAAGFGRVWLLDLLTGDTISSGGDAFAIQGAARLQEASSSPAIGFIPIQDNSGGLDRVMYVASHPAATRPAGMTSLWLGAKGENPVNLQIAGDRLLLTTRAALQGLPVLVPNANSVLGVKISFVRANGDPFTLAQIGSLVTGVINATATPGEISVQLQGPAVAAYNWDGTNPALPSIGVRVDYTIDWSRCVAGTTPADAFIRGNLEFPDDGSNQRRVIGSPAMTRHGNVVVLTSAPTGGTPGGTYFNFREEGRGDFVLLSRYDLTDQITLRLNNQSVGGPIYRETIIDEDELLSEPAIGFLRQRVTGLRFVTPPAVLGDNVHVMAVGNKNIGFANSPTSVLLTFKANPDPVSFEVENWNETNANRISLVQPDPAKSANKASPDQFSVLARDRFVVEPIGGNRVKVTIPSLMAGTRGPIRDALSTSLPLIVRGTQATDRLVEPEASSANGQFLAGNAAGRFNPLLWYWVANGYRGLAGPVATGDTMYVGGASVLPSLVATGFSGIQENGLMFAIGTQVSANDPFLQSNTIRAWQTQLMSVRRNSATPFDFRPATAFKWPQIQGIQTGDDFRVRLLQAAVPDTSIAFLAAGDGILAGLGGANGAYLFSRAEFTVVDSQRVSRFDQVGNPIWTISQTTAGGPQQAVAAAQVTKSLSSPNRAYPEGLSAIWIVDTGADRILQTDRSGVELRSVTDFRVHPSFVPNGYQAGESRKLRGPRDVLVYTTRRTAAQVAAIFPGETLAETATNEIWRHIVVADAGNARAVELIDRYRTDANGRTLGVVRYGDNTEPPIDTAGNRAFVPALGVLFWHSPEELSGGNFGYNSIYRTVTDTGAGLRSIVAFGFGAVQPGRNTVGLDSAVVDQGGRTGFGGVVIYDGPNTRVINEFTRPPIPAGMYVGWNGTGYVFNTPAANQPAVQQKISGLSGVSLKLVATPAGPRLGVMISEASGVYELVQASTVPGDPNADVWGVNWMMPRQAYIGMRRPRGNPPGGGWSVGQMGNNPSSLRAMFAKRLESGDIMLVNGYEGTLLNGAEFRGEVVLIEGRTGDATTPGYSLALPNLGFNSLSVKFELPPVQGTRGLIRPIFADGQ